LWKTTDKNRKQITIKLNKVRFVPNLKTNLLSLSALFQQYPKASEIYRNNKNIIIKIRQNEIEFKLKDKLFVNNPENIFSVNVKAVKTTISEEDFKQEHIRMGHINAQDLAIMLRKESLKIKNDTIKNFKCETCLLTKSTIKRPIETGRIAGNHTSPGSFIHSDLAGPENSYNNKNFVINFIDDNTGATYVKFIEKKNEVPTAIKDFIKDCKNGFLKLQIGDNTTFHSDGEAIYKSKAVKEVLDENNIYQNYSQNYLETYYMSRVLVVQQ